MCEPMLDRVVRHRLAVLRHAEEVTGAVAMTTSRMNPGGRTSST